MLAEDPRDLGDLMVRLNRLLCSSIPSNRFISLFLCVLDPVKGETIYCNAGHNPPALVRAGGQVEWLQGGGPILGILPNAAYEQKTCRLERGDSIVLYSDGVTEMTNPAGEEFGEERLAQVLAANRGKPAAEIVQGVRAELAKFAAGAPAADDITLVVAKKGSA